MRLTVDPSRPYYCGRRLAIALACLAAVVVLSLGCTRLEMSGCTNMCGAAGVDTFSETTVPGIAQAQPTCKCRQAPRADGGRP